MKKDNSSSSENWAALGREVLDIEIEALGAVRAALGETFAQAVELLASCRGRVVVCGLGKSGLVGRKLAATFSSTGTPAFFLHPVEGAHGDLGSIRPEDVVIAISNSGKTDELNAILPSLRVLGVKIIALTGGLDSPLARLSDLVVNAAVPREACPMNLAPTSSTTAALALGDALAVCLIRCHSFTEKDFKRFHPGGALGQRLALKVEDLMRGQNLPQAGQETPCSAALNTLDQGGLGAVIITDSAGRLAGILTDGDVRRHFLRGTITPAAPASSIMTVNPRRAKLGQSVAELIDIMEEKSITVLPVTDEAGVVAGVVHLHDLLGKGRIKFGG